MKRYASSTDNNYKGVVSGTIPSSDGIIEPLAGDDYIVSVKELRRCVGIS